MEMLLQSVFSAAEAVGWRYPSGRSASESESCPFVPEQSDLSDCAAEAGGGEGTDM